MNPIMKQLGDDMAAIFGAPRIFEGIARPVSPHPRFPVVEVPEDRSDFTRDDESTGV